MARNIIKVFNGKSSYYITVPEAKHLTATKQATWTSPIQINLTPDRNIGVTWAVKQSGYAGPQVMQVITAIILCFLLR